jgi:quercetin dioxygenase-like cupin family protein
VVHWYTQIVEFKRRAGKVQRMPKTIIFSWMGIVAAAILFPLATLPLSAEQQAITHTSLLRNQLRDVAEEVIVWDTEYAPGAVNPRHFHPAAITFRVISGTGVWQEEGKAPVTLHAGDSLLAPAGTVHSHWNPSSTEQLRFLEFIVAEEGKGRSIPRP